MRQRASDPCPACEGLRPVFQVNSLPTVYTNLYKIFLLQAYR